MHRRSGEAHAQYSPVIIIAVFFESRTYIWPSPCAAARTPFSSPLHSRAAPLLLVFLFFLLFFGPVLFSRAVCVLKALWIITPIKAARLGSALPRSTTPCPRPRLLAATTNARREVKSASLHVIVVALLPRSRKSVTPTSVPYPSRKAATSRSKEAAAASLQSPSGAGYVHSPGGLARPRYSTSSGVLLSCCAFAYRTSSLGRHLGGASASAALRCGSRPVLPRALDDGPGATAAAEHGEERACSPDCRRRRLPPAPAAAAPPTHRACVRACCTCVSMSWRSGLGGCAGRHDGSKRRLRGAARL